MGSERVLSGSGVGFKVDLERVLRWAWSWFEGGLEVGLECF